MSASMIANGDIWARKPALIGYVDENEQVVLALGQAEVVRVTSNVTLGDAHREKVVEAVSDSGPITLTIDAADPANAKMRLWVQRRGSNSVTIQVSNGTANGSATPIVLDSDKDFTHLVVDQANTDVVSMASGGSVEGVGVSATGPISVQQGGTATNPTYAFTFLRDADPANMLKVNNAGEASVRLFTGAGFEGDPNDANNPLRVSQVALVEPIAVADIAARDALTNIGQGDVVVVADKGTGLPGTYMRNSTGSWIELQFGVPVISVNGKVGSVVLGTRDLSDVSNAQATTGQALVWDGSVYAPTTIKQANTFTIGNVALTPGTPIEIAHNRDTKFINVSFIEVNSQRGEMVGWNRKVSDNANRIEIDGKVAKTYDVLVVGA